MRRTWAPDCICNYVTLGEYSGSALRPATPGVSGFCDDGQGPIRVFCGSWYILSVMMLMDTGCAMAWLYTQSTSLSFVSLLKTQGIFQNPYTLHASQVMGTQEQCCLPVLGVASVKVAPPRTQSICGMQKFYKFPYRLKFIVISGGGSGGGGGVCIALGTVAEARGCGVNSLFLPLGGF